MSFNWELAKAYGCEISNEFGYTRIPEYIDVKISDYKSTHQYSVSISKSAYRRICGGDSTPCIRLVLTRTRKQLYFVPADKGFRIENNGAKNGRYRFRFNKKLFDNLSRFVGTHKLHFNDQLDGHYITAEEEIA